MTGSGWPLMSDMSAVEVIAGVLAGPHRVWSEYDGDNELMVRCRCDVDNPHLTNGVPDGAWMPLSQYHIHVAAEVDKALGGLTREAALSYSPPNDPDSATFHTDPVDIKALRTFLGSSVDVYRWVGGWTPEEAS